MYLGFTANWKQKRLGGAAGISDWGFGICQEIQYGICADQCGYGDQYQVSLRVDNKEDYGEGGTTEVLLAEINQEAIKFR